MKSSIKIIFVLLYMLLLIQCTEKKEDISIRIIQTTDVHGSIYPFDFINNKATSNSLAQVYTYVKEVRKNNPESTILLDNGDYLQGQPAVYYYNFEDTSSPHLGAQVFNYMQYDAATVGNHDIETGHQVYDRFRKELNAPYLAANAIKANGEPYFEPYTIIERKGIKIAVIGLITPGIPNWLPEVLWEGMEFTDMINSAKKWIEVIEEKHQPDLVIGMFHSGIDHSYGNKNAREFMNENATKLVAENVDGFDIILAGHDHREYNQTITNKNGNSVLILDPRSHARAVSDIAVEFTYNTATKKYDKTITGEVVDIQDQKADEEFIANFEEEYKKIQHFVNKEIGELTMNLSTKNAYFESTPFINLIHEVQLDNSAAHISFSSPLSFNTSVNKGPIYMRDLFKLYKYENMLYTLSLTGKEIDRYLEYSYGQWFNTMKNSDDHMLKLIKEDSTTKLEGKYYNLSSAYGIEYIVDLQKEDGNKINIIGQSNGKPFHRDSTYLVAVNSYRGNGGGGHLTEGIGIDSKELKERLVHSSEKDLRFYIMQWVTKNKSISPDKRKNWKTIPEDYFEKGKHKDMILLFPKN